MSFYFPLMNLFDKILSHGHGYACVFSFHLGWLFWLLLQTLFLCYNFYFRLSNLFPQIQFLEASSQPWPHSHSLPDFAVSGTWLFYASFDSVSNSCRSSEFCMLQRKRFFSRLKSMFPNAPDWTYNFSYCDLFFQNRIF